MKNANRIAIYICGIFLLALGGVLAIKSNLGASPVSSLPLSISKVTSISLGRAAAILFIIYVGIQILILRRDFKIVQLLQIMNFFNAIININIDSFYIRIVICILSFFITAFGVTFTITANIVPVAPDGLAQVISKKAKIEFGKAKIYFDCVVVALSVGILLINNKGLDGLGIGTVLSALLVGRIVAYINKNLKHKIENICFVEAA
ncbi:YczE/YyaS/YitT family protein [Clostridium disporicum]|uniref:Predicted membrane protein n=1 Tax=Clostridium disporicum TaxID=84024 RepID=A0A174G8E2_9CLOT|nr:DUF6198 family protein [Clostridium disporicum]CUO58251.1 Predicted membrane protein [Clostridium disporicum]